MTKPTAKGPRKKSPRGKGKLSKRPSPTAAHSRLKWLWANDPEFQEKMRLRTERMLADRKANPAKYSRYGVPDGMRRAQAAPLWARARELADRFIVIMKDKGELPATETLDASFYGVVVPETDAGKAEAALHECFVLAVGPSDQKIKIQAINTVLNFTKAKPESRSKLTLNKAEDFLDALGDD